MDVTQWEVWQAAAVLMVLAIALAYDLKQHRVPNLLSLAALLVGLVSNSLLLGWSGLFSSLGGLLLGLGLMLPFYWKKGMGAGDVKLMAAVGAMLGTSTVLIAIAATLISGAVIASTIVLVLGGAGEWLGRYKFMAKTLMGAGVVLYLEPAKRSVSSLRFPYVTAIATGTVVAMYLRGMFAPFSYLMAGGQA